MALTRVVVGIDGSPGSDGALAWAAASFPDVELVAVHGFPGEDRHTVRLRPDLDALRSDHERLLGSEWVAAGSGHPALSALLVDSDGATALLKAASELEADAIVVGHKGRSRWSEEAIGSVVGRLLHRSGRPVIITNERVAIATVSQPVAVALWDLEEPGAPLEWAVDFASERHLPLRLVHVVEPLRYVRSNHAVDLSALRVASQGSLDDVLHKLSIEHPDIDVSSEVLSGEPIDELAAVSQGAGMVVVGSRRLGGVETYALGSVAHHLPALAACPVVAVPM